jgi:rubredoxin
MGTKYPFGDSPYYPPRDWTCPECKKYHSKPHFAYYGQIDYSKNTQEYGRVKFNREGSGMDCDDHKEYDMPLKPMAEATGPQFGRTGKQRPLFCPHCGWEEVMIYITKVKKK